ncbi:hypothetical protein B5807_10730 [Epicoccum nigrum]|uniref:Uncharacterized protein n=1 Tax=Epicoccum nigrum TaxID=105696 RepID=A0A1Y2LLJ4_EPING|nr:hypothetical protein B5807_10730 [Epicoccum nigrum]
MGQGYAKAKNKGCTLWATMHSDDSKAGQPFTPSQTSAHSDYVQLYDLMKWAYVTKSAKKSSKCDMGNGKDIYGLQGILEAKGISANKRDWECVRITHSDPEDKSANINDQTYTNPRTEETVRVTGAIFQFAINAKDGVLVVAKLYGPAHQANYRRPPVPVEELPVLRSLSDITWLAWRPYHDKDVKLKHVIMWSVVNGGTQRLVAAALEDMSEKPLNDADETLKPYPWN